jgi:hypothetical protein
MCDVWARRLMYGYAEMEEGEEIYEGSGRWKDPCMRDVVEVEKDKRPEGRRFEVSSRVSCTKGKSRIR